MGTNPHKITFAGKTSGGSTNPAKGKQGNIPLGTSSTNPTSKTGKQKNSRG